MASGSGGSVEQADAGGELGPDEVAIPLCCSCGSEGLRVLGVTAVMGSAGGRGGFVWRSLVRVMREVRAAADTATRGSAGRFDAPIFFHCVRCSTRTPLPLAPPPPDAPGGEAALEAYRCRPCRRSTFSAFVVLRYAGLDDDEPTHAGDEEGYDRWSLFVRCKACGRSADVAREVIRSERDLAVDRLYGRSHGAQRPR